jgi:putative hemolysin
MGLRLSRLEAMVLRSTRHRSRKHSREERMGKGLIGTRRSTKIRYSRHRSKVTSLQRADVEVEEIGLHLPPAGPWRKVLIQSIIDQSISWLLSST